MKNLCLYVVIWPANKALLPFLLGIGIQTFSVSPRWIPRVQQRIVELRVREAEALAEEILSKGQVREV